MSDSRRLRGRLDWSRVQKRVNQDAVDDAQEAAGRSSQMAMERDALQTLLEQRQPGSVAVAIPLPDRAITGSITQYAGYMTPVFVFTAEHLRQRLVDMNPAIRCWGWDHEQRAANLMAEFNRPLMAEYDQLQGAKPPTRRP